MTGNKGDVSSEPPADTSRQSGRIGRLLRKTRQLLGQLWHQPVYFPVMLTLVLCVVLKRIELELIMQATLRGRHLWRWILPEVALLPTMGVLLALLLPHLSEKRRRLGIFVLISLLALQTLLLGLDTLSVQARLSPVHFLELRQLFSQPALVWPVIASELTPLRVLLLLGGSALISGFFFWMWRRSLRLLRTPHPLHLSRHVQLGVGLLGLVAFFARFPVQYPLKIVQPPALERLGTGLISTLRLEAHSEVVAVPDLMTVDRSQGRPPFNILLILLESTALKHFTKENMPHLYQLREEGVSFENAYSTATHSSKAIVGLLCGQPPFPDVRVLEADGVLLNRCLPEVLGQGGYRTAWMQAPNLKFERRDELTRAMGFQSVIGGKLLPQKGFERANYFGLEDRAVIGPALTWLERGNRPWFIGFMTGSSHHPYYVPGQKMVEEDHGHEETRARYLKSLKYVDATVNELLERLKDRGLLKNTLVVAVGDHGEAFNEHGLLFHDWVPYEEGSRVPLFFWGPEVLASVQHPEVQDGRGVLSGNRHQIDIFPTLLSLLGWTFTPGTLPGTAAFEGQGHARVYSLCWSASQCMGMREGNLKYIIRDWSDLPEVYDLKVDPDEKSNIAEQLPREKLKAVHQELWQYQQQVSSQYLTLSRAGGRSAEDPFPPAEQLETGGETPGTSP